MTDPVSGDIVCRFRPIFGIEYPFELLVVCHFISDRHPPIVGYLLEGFVQYFFILSPSVASVFGIAVSYTHLIDLFHSRPTSITSCPNNENREGINFRF